MKIISSVLFLSMFCCTSLVAQDHTSIVRQASDKHDYEYLDNWAFTETRDDGEEIRVAHFDPARADSAQWQLESVNGEPPDQETIEAFLEVRAKRKEQREQEPENNGLWEMITPGSLELLEENADGWRFSFQPQDEEDQDFMKHVKGELLVVKDGHYIGVLTMASRESFKPQTGVRIDSFEVTMKFGPVAGEGPVVPLSMTSRIRGKAFLLASVEEDVVVEFSNYQQVAQADEEQ